MPPHLVFLSGGRSEECSISLESARNIYPHLDHANFQVTPVFVAPDGSWRLPEPQIRDWPALSKNWNQLPAAALLPGLCQSTGRAGLQLQNLSSKECRDIDLFYPVFHGPGGEDGTFQGMAEFFQIPIVGSNMTGSLLSMDKALMKILFERAGLPIARYRALKPDSPSARSRTESTALGIKLFQEWQCGSLFVKPARMGSSIGISQIQKAEELFEALQHALQYDSKILIEEGLSAIELEFALLETDTLLISKAAAIHSQGLFYSFERKYNSDAEAEPIRIQNVCQLPGEILHEAQQLAQKAFYCLEARHYSRVDLFYLAESKENKLLINEINAIPGFTKNSMYPKLMAEAGWPLQALIPHLTRLAWEKKSGGK